MEACWAHNPEIRGSKSRSAKNCNVENDSTNFCQRPLAVMDTLVPVRSRKLSITGCGAVWDGCRSVTALTYWDAAARAHFYRGLGRTPEGETRRYNHQFEVAVVVRYA